MKYTKVLVDYEGLVGEYKLQYPVTFKTITENFDLEEKEWACLLVLDFPVEVPRVLLLRTEYINRIEFFSPIDEE